MLSPETIRDRIESSLACGGVGTEDGTAVIGAEAGMDPADEVAAATSTGAGRIGAAAASWTGAGVGGAAAAPAGAAGIVDGGGAAMAGGAAGGEALDGASGSDASGARACRGVGVVAVGSTPRRASAASSDSCWRSAPTVVRGAGCGAGGRALAI